MEARKRGRPKKTEGVKKVEKKKVTAVAVVEMPKKEELSELAINKAFDLLGIGAKLDAQSRALFVEIAKLHHLNPLKREIHAVTMAGKLVPVVGYEVYIQRARDTGLLQYWNIEEEGDGATYKATLVIKRRDWPKEFRWTARFTEVKRQGPMWQERPTFMTQKVAISQGFRLCFGDELGGMPYTVEEMSETGNGKAITVEATVVENGKLEIPAPSPETMAKVLPKTEGEYIETEVGDVPKVFWKARDKMVLFEAFGPAIDYRVAKNAEGMWKVTKVEQQAFDLGVKDSEIPF